MANSDARIRGRAASLLGPLAAFVSLTVLVLGAGATRPTTAADGVWTTPLEVLLGVVGLALLAGLVVLARVLPGSAAGGTRVAPRRRWARLGALAVGGLVLWLVSLLTERTPPGLVAAGAALPLTLVAGDGTDLPAATAAAAAIVVVALLLAVASGPSDDRNDVSPRRTEG